MKVTCFIGEREAIPEFCEITGANPITVEYEFEKALIHEKVCVFDVEMTAAQKQAFEKHVKDKAKKRKG